MAAFAYSAIAADGLAQAGEIHAPNPDAAREQLRIRGLLAERLEELPASGEEGARTAFKKVKPKTLQIFSRQFATMIEAGLNVVSSLVILEEQTDDEYFASVVKEIRADVEGGLLLSQALARHPKIFSRLYVSMVEAGEAAGILDQVLDRVAFQIEKDTQIRRRVKGAMMYPTMVMIFATLVLVGLLMFLVPVFVNIFAQLGGKLPTLTQYVVSASNVLRSYWFIIFPTLLPGDLGRPPLQAHGTGPPALGPDQAQDPDEDRRRRPQGDDGALLADALDPRRRGRRHHQGARNHGQTAGNWVVEEALSGVRAKVHQGVPIAQPLIENDVFPPMVSQMVKIGEETGELEKMLSKIADFYEDEVDSSIATLTSIIEPLMMIMVGAMVGVIVISMYLPMFKMLSLVK
jgi:type IV pilus assembly protein PilC